MCIKKKYRVPSRYDYVEYERMKNEVADRYGYGVRYDAEIRKIAKELAHGSTFVYPLSTTPGPFLFVTEQFAPQSKHKGIAL